MEEAASEVKEPSGTEVRQTGKATGSASEVGDSASEGGEEGTRPRVGEAPTAIDDGEQEAGPMGTETLGTTEPIVSEPARDVGEREVGADSGTGREEQSSEGASEHGNVGSSTGAMEVGVPASEVGEPTKEIGTCETETAEGRT